MNLSTKKERRLFLKRLGIGSASLGLTATGLAKSDPVFAKLEAKIAISHASELMAKINKSKPSNESQRAFESSYNTLMDMIVNKKDKDAVRVYNETSDYIKKVSLQEFGVYLTDSTDVPEELTFMMAGGYLAASNVLQFGGYGENELRRSFSLVKPLEPGFLKALSRKLQQESNLNYEIAEKISNTALPIANKSISNKSQRVDPGDVTWGLIGLVVAFVIFSIAVWGEKR